MLDQRVRRAAEQILADESLTDELDDVPAQKLLHWGLQISEQIVRQTGHLDDQMAEEFLYTPTVTLRRLIRAINKLAGTPSDYAPEEVAEQLGAILGFAAELPALAASAPENPDMEARLIRMSPQGAALDRILNLLAIKGASDGEAQ
jgi:hypothetical protein